MTTQGTTTRLTKHTDQQEMEVPGQRETLVLAYFGGYTQQEIAVLTDTPLGTVKTRTLAALRKLRTGLAGYDENGNGGGPT